MTALRIINLIVWGALFLYMVCGAWSAAHGMGVRVGDPMRLASAAVALLVCGFTLGPMVAPNSNTVWAGLHVLKSGVVTTKVETR